MSRLSKMTRPQLEAELAEHGMAVEAKAAANVETLRVMLQVARDLKDQEQAEQAPGDEPNPDSINIPEAQSEPVAASTPSATDISDDDDDSDDDESPDEPEAEADGDYITVRAVGVDGRVGFWEKSPEHPGGEVFLRSGETGRVGLTPRVHRLLGDRLVEVDT